MSDEDLKKATDLRGRIATLELELNTLTRIEENTRSKKLGTHKLQLNMILKKPEKKTAHNYWSSQDLDFINSIILFDPDDVQVLIDCKKSKLDKLRAELDSI